MIKKFITYTDFNGEEQREAHYFNLTKAELVELEFSKEGSFQSRINKIVESNDNHEIIAAFKDIILRSYGVRSDDGKTFRKTAEASKDFSQTEAYSELFMELATNDGAGAEFISGLVPANLASEVSKDVRARSESNMQGHQKSPEAMPAVVEEDKDVTEIKTPGTEIDSTRNVFEENSAEAPKQTREQLEAQLKALDEEQ